MDASCDEVVPTKSRDLWRLSSHLSIMSLGDRHRPQETASSLRATKGAIKTEDVRADLVALREASFHRAF
jgi:hypothetical protein